MPPHPTYITIGDARYFLGIVALVNSLRLTGNAGPIVVLDGGLTTAQKKILGGECDVRDIPANTSGTLAFYFKPMVARIGVSGIVTYLDSDMIVTSALAPLIAPAREGRFVVFPDGIERRFDEWQPLLGLSALPRRDQPYVNAGFFAADVDVWAPTFSRWWELADFARRHRAQNPWGHEDFSRDAEDALFYHEQDVLNAILMSEVERERICLLDRGLFGVPGWPLWEAGGKIVDRRTLMVVDEGRRLSLLHYWDYPKPWLPGSRTKVKFEAYIELMARVLTADDAPISIPKDRVPMWLRDDILGRVVRRGPRRARRSVKHALGLLPHPLDTWAISAGEAFLNRVKR